MAKPVKRETYEAVDDALKNLYTALQQFVKLGEKTRMLFNYPIL